MSWLKVPLYSETCGPHGWYLMEPDLGPLSVLHLCLSFFIYKWGKKCYLQGGNNIYKEKERLMRGNKRQQ